MSKNKLEDNKLENVNVKEFLEHIEKYSHLEGNERWIKREGKEILKDKAVAQRRKLESQDLADLENIVYKLEGESPNFPDLVQELFEWRAHLYVYVRGQEIYYITQHFCNAVRNINELWGLNPEHGDLEEAIEDLRYCIRCLPAYKG